MDFMYLPPAKCVLNANVANLAAYTVAANAATNDNVATVQGDLVFAVAQTTLAQNGPYVVGVVAAGVAPLTRPPWWAPAQVFSTGVGVRIGPRGNVYRNTTWRAMLVADTFIVDTDDPQLYPEEISTTLTLVNGTVTSTLFPVRSAASWIGVMRNIGGAVGSALTVEYAVSAVAGVLGTGSVTVEADIAAGTINVADGSTLRVKLFNQRS